jgi:NAD(P)-dependent dehydrogenase (short-subunit alcohol dehydrogenase family)
LGWKASDIPDQSGRVAVVTGGNGGLGLATSRQLAAHGAHVVIGARNLDKAEAARRTIADAVPGASIEVRHLDLASLASIEAFAQAVAAAHPRIDLLFNNAGLMAVPEGKTADGFETQFGTNHLGHFALTMQLLPALLAAPSPRVVSTTSTARFMAGRYDLSNPHMRGCYDAWEAYGMSKRAALQFAFELNRRLKDRGLAAFAADPGFSKTDLQGASLRANPGLMQRFWRVAVAVTGQPASMGALPQLRAATDPAAVGGTLYTPRWITFGAPVVRGVGRSIDRHEQMAQLWALSELETGLTLEVALAAS